MESNVIDYKKLVDEAMHIIVYKVLSQIEKSGLPGNHHFYISFLTKAPDVKISKYLLSKYPKEMTIILQHQFKNLKVNKMGFEVSLSFGGVTEHIIIPFSAITSFADPSVQFGLQFREAAHEQSENHSSKINIPIDEDDLVQFTTEEKITQQKPNNIISLEEFRKKSKKKIR